MEPEDAPRPEGARRCRGPKARGAAVARKARGAAVARRRAALRRTTTKTKTKMKTKTMAPLPRPSQRHPRLPRHTTCPGDSSKLPHLPNAATPAVSRAPRTQRAPRPVSDSSLAKASDRRRREAAYPRATAADSDREQPLSHRRMLTGSTSPATHSCQTRRTNRCPT